MTQLIAQLPAVRGRLIENAPIGKQTWFGVGGPAEVLFRPADAEDLAVFLSALPAEVPVTVIGIGSNLLVRDGGIRGVVIRLGRGFAAIQVDREEIHAGAAALDRIVACAAAEAGLGGLEFLSGIPGSIGGSVRMNAGAYGQEVRDVLAAVTALDRSSKTHTVSGRTIGLSYRRSDVDPSWIVIGARLRGTQEDRAAIGRRLDEIRAVREATQPVRARTGGSTFKNPPGESAWHLIDAAGCRGLVRGGAMVSQQHTNFLINTGTAQPPISKGSAKRSVGGSTRAPGFSWSGKSSASVEAKMTDIHRLLPFTLPLRGSLPLPACRERAGVRGTLTLH